MRLIHVNFIAFVSTLAIVHKAGRVLCLVIQDGNHELWISGQTRIIQHKWQLSDFGALHRRIRLAT